MRHWIATAAAVTAAPLLVACASAGAAQSEFADSNDRHRNVLIVNGERIVVQDGAHAIHIIEDALEDGESASLSLDFDFDAHSWSEEDLAQFEAEMEELGESLGAMFAGGSDLQIAVDRLNLNEEALQARIEVIVEQSERRAERAERLAERSAERAERDAERIARQAERQARRAEARAVEIERRAHHAALRAEQTERHALSISINADSIAQAGLMAAETGLESGLAAIERTLERGWKTEDGERVPLTRQDREELNEAREGLEDSLRELREERADWHEEHRARAPHPRNDNHDRQVRIIERDGETRVWVNGRELTGAEKETWLEAWRSSEQAQELEGGPAAPPTPPTPPRR